MLNTLQCDAILAIFIAILFPGTYAFPLSPLITPLIPSPTLLPTSPEEALLILSPLQSLPSEALDTHLPFYLSALTDSVPLDAVYTQTLLHILTTLHNMDIMFIDNLVLLPGELYHVPHLSLPQTVQTILHHPRTEAVFLHGLISPHLVECVGNVPLRFIGYIHMISTLPPQLPMALFQHFTHAEGLIVPWVIEIANSHSLPASVLHDLSLSWDYQGNGRMNNPYGTVHPNQYARQNLIANLANRIDRFIRHNSR